MNKLIGIFFLALVIQSCGPQSKPESKAMLASGFYKTELFKDVQLSGIFPDSKTFVDCTPKKPYSEVVAAYKEQKDNAKFDLKAFVDQHFDMPHTPTNDFKSDTSNSMVQHIDNLWPVLTRSPDKHNPLSSLIPLPNAYIVPGGRFREIYYWDSYFTIEGLMEAGETKMAKNMLDNFTFLIDSLGFIPNGNRAYYLGRSQPPFYAAIVSRIASGNKGLFVEYLPEMVAEYNFWMKGESNLKKGEALHRVVKLEDGKILNRYWDDIPGPRPESFKPDYQLIHNNNLDSTAVYTHLRAGAESGWDYCSRWFSDKKTLNTIETTDIIPVDLNALLYNLELNIAKGYEWNGRQDSANYYLDRAEKRKAAINTYLWDEGQGFFVDYNFKRNTSTGVHSLAAAYPLFFKIATQDQAERTAQELADKFLFPGGFVSTLNDTGEQWDYPNGWAPLQWMTVNGLLNYGFDEPAVTGMKNWLKRNKEVYKATGKMMEKYNVVDTTLLGGGGEYALQDGFGWSNGVALAFQAILDKRTVAKPVE